MWSFRQGAQITLQHWQWLIPNSQTLLWSHLHIGEDPFYPAPLLDRQFWYAASANLHEEESKTRLWFVSFRISSGGFNFTIRLPILLMQVKSQVKNPPDFCITQLVNTQAAHYTSSCLSLWRGGTTELGWPFAGSPGVLRTLPGKIIPPTDGGTEVWLPWYSPHQDWD